MEKRLKLWVKQGSWYVINDQIFKQLGGHEIEIVKNGIRNGDFWYFLKNTSTPCSCIMCKGERYKRITKSELKKIIDEK